ncbi:MAG TPA: hypothetical protein VMQ93_05385, partial [Novosphingobium sp.]|nr:hypothetical protein [Novosphingobium sp.]
MERHVPHRCALVLICAAVPASAGAQTVAATAAGGFDLRAVGGRTGPGAARTNQRSQPEALDVELAKPEKTKLRLTYQPDDEGPRFEIGTLGSRKGAMKSRLLHVAMDWNF